MSVVAAQTGWRSMDSAPKDGTDVILYFPAFRHKVLVGRFYSTETFNHGKSTGKHEYWSYGEFIACDLPIPTHWMPIPDAPK